MYTDDCLKSNALGVRNYAGTQTTMFVLHRLVEMLVLVLLSHPATWEHA